MIDNQSILKIDFKTEAKGCVVLDDKACLADDSSTAGSSISGSSITAFCNVSASMELGYEDSNNGKECSLAERRITQGDFTIVSVRPSAAMQDRRAKIQTKIFKL